MKPVRQKRKPRNEPRLLWLFNLQQRRQKYIMMGEKSPFNKGCWENWSDAKESNRTTLSHHTQKSMHNGLKTIKDLNVRPKTIKLLEKKIVIIISSLTQILVIIFKIRYIFSGKENKSKN